MTPEALDKAFPVVNVNHIRVASEMLRLLQCIRPFLASYAEHLPKLNASPEECERGRQLVAHIDSVIAAAEGSR